ncbi:MAG: metallophosphoesterase [Oscillospiraceae bacterium]|nr:metallophosphoesterase [Oscillospiraceae bacterium]
MKKLISVLLMSALLLTACASDPKDDKTEVTLFHATDMHYLSQQLTDNSAAFVNMLLEGDGKMTHYSEEICDAFVENVINQKPDAVLIGGDITFNCEKLSHEDFILKLKKIEDAGIDVLAIPGNHDVEYPFSRGYEGEYSYKTDYTTEADFVEYYKEFGPDIAYTKSPDGLSYIAKLGKDIYVAAIYTPQSFMSGATGAEEEMLAWLDTELAKLDKNAKIVALTHQNIVNHYDDEEFSLQYTIVNNEELIEIYDKYGVDVNLSGHIHLQSIAYTPSGIADIATSSMTIRECQYGVVRVTPEKMFYNVQKIDVQGWAEANGIDDEALLEFDKYNDGFYFTSAYAKAMSSLEQAKLTPEERDALAVLWANFNVNYFAGTLNEYYPQMLESEGYKVWQEKGLDDNWSFNYILKACDENKINNPQTNLEIALETE